MTTVGRVVALCRYPVKSMAAEPLDGVEVSWHGLAGDRRWAFIRDGQVRSDFPWLTIRERPEMAHYRRPAAPYRGAEPDRPRMRSPGGDRMRPGSGAMQLTYNKHPLYYLAAGTAAGQDHGQGSTAFGAGWHVVNVQGAKIDND